jgi:uncharacterized protein YbaA (DUF1428 family)
MPYVDGYVLAVPKKNLPAYRECAGDDLDVKGMVPFPRRVRLRRGETVMFSWIVFKSRAHGPGLRR